MLRKLQWISTLALFIAGVLVNPEPLSSQVDSRNSRTAAVRAGVGNSFGWLGAQAERYFLESGMSGFVGVGYVPSDDGDPAFAGGLRGFTKGERHRGFLELSVSTVLRESRVLVTPEGASSEDSNLYGPGLQVGYAYTAGWGFAAMASVGLGYALGMASENDASPLAMLFGIGLGYTWR